MTGDERRVGETPAIGLLDEIEDALGTRHLHDDLDVDTALAHAAELTRMAHERLGGTHVLRVVEQWHQHGGERRGRSTADQPARNADDTRPSNGQDPASVDQRRRIIVAAETVDLEPGAAVMIGRHGDHRVEDPRVSRRHLHVSCDGSGLVCRDVGSANGSWLVRGDVRTPIEGIDVDLIVGDRVVTIGDIELVTVAGDP